jgi:hypothetical protein
MHMLKATNEEWGTVAGLTALTRDLDDTSADGEFFFIVITVSTASNLCDH